MDCYFITGIDTAQRLVRVQHCTVGNTKIVTADDAFTAAMALKLKGLINDALVPCFEADGNFSQDYYFCNHKLYRFIDWVYHEVFPFAKSARFEVYVITGNLVITGKARYIYCKMASLAAGYHILSVEVFSRDTYDIVAVQSIKTGTHNFITAIATELYKVTSKRVSLVRCTDFEKYERTMARARKARESGVIYEYDKLIRSMQKLDLVDDGMNVYLEGVKIY